jgi:hypothetical protein
MAGPLARAAAVAAAVLALAAAGVAQGHTRSYYSSLSLTINRSPAGDTFLGRVGAPKAICRRGRKVVVHQIRSGSDTRIGADVTGADGKWVVDPPGKSIGGGRYYATMRSKPLLETAAHDHSCAPVTTRPITIG